MQAGGGLPAALDEGNDIQHFSPAVVGYLKGIYDALGDPGLASMREDIAQFRQQRKKLPPSNLPPSQIQGDSPIDFESFLGYFVSEDCNALAPPPTDDLSIPLSDYFISSSHNTYLTGNQLYGQASTEVYKNVLLRGCRCVEIDVWDGVSPSDEEVETDEDEGKGSIRDRLKKEFSKVTNKSDPDSNPKRRQESAYDMPGEVEKLKPWRSQPNRVEPRVLHGHTATKEVSFRNVCKAIRKYAFVNSDLPIIVSLEVHAGHEQQEIMVEIMEEYWGGMLVRLPQYPDNPPEDLPLPSIAEIRNKILVKVKYSPKPPPKSQSLSGAIATHTRHLSLNSAAGTALQSTASDSSASSSDNEDEMKVDQKAHGKIISSLGRLGIYTRSCHFKSFTQPEAHLPTHVFALSESKLMSTRESGSTALFTHNKRYLMRVYPKGTRFSSSNLDPSIFWRQGVQMVALNWQSWDEGTMLNEAMFAGTGGWVLKPRGYRSTDTATHQREAVAHGILDLSIEVLAAQDLPAPEGKKEMARPFVKCELHVEKEEERQDKPIPGGGKSKDAEIKQKTRVVKAKDGEADFGREVIKFAEVNGVVPELSFVR